ncbi:MAG: bacillithiol transferase BstA [Pyrinomonadaceae bacterium]
MEKAVGEDLRYPIGTFDPSVEVTKELKESFIKDLEELPALLREAVKGLSDEQLDTHYRPGGWTVRQVVHHVVDSHINAYVRFKWTLTEDKPTIKTYFEERWAELGDSRMPVENSLLMAENLHRRWVDLIRWMSDEDFARKLNHPDWGELTLDKMLGQYAWHGKHHTAHITRLAEREGW